MKKTVLLIDDGNIQHSRIAKCLSDMGANPLVLDVRHLLSKDYEVSLSYSNGSQGGIIRSKHGINIEIEKLFSVYVRGYTFSISANQVVDPGAKRWVEREAKSNLISIIEIQNKKTINSPIKSMAAGDKITQMLIANEVGLQTPKTLLTNSLKELSDFRSECDGKVIFKSTCPPIVDTLDSRDPKTIYTNVLTNCDYKLDKEIASSLSLFQERVAKDYELRVIVVGEKIFACKIDSQKNSDTQVDWRRYNLDETPHEKYVLPEDVKDKLLKIVKSYNLIYGAFDLIVTPDGRYVYLELNPDGIYDWVEQLTGAEISKAIAEELVMA